MSATSADVSLAMQRELRDARRELFRRGLNAAAAWASEQLVGIVHPASEARTRTVRHDADSDAVLFAKSLFDMKEYRRAAKHLETATDSVGCFLRCYATFLAGEKHKEERIAEMQDKLTSVQNKALPELSEELEALCAAHQGDGPLLYLLGLVLRESGKPQRALEALQESVASFPLNWSAWSELCTICVENEQLIPELKLSNHWVTGFMHGKLSQLLQRNQESLDCFSRLRHKFPRSCFVLAQQAICCYEMHDFDEAESLFEELVASDPFRLSVMVGPRARPLALDLTRCFGGSGQVFAYTVCEGGEGEAVPSRTALHEGR